MKLKDRHPIADLILRYRTIAKVSPEASHSIPLWSASATLPRRQHWILVVLDRVQPRTRSQPNHTLHHHALPGHSPACLPCVTPSQIKHTYLEALGKHSTSSGPMSRLRTKTLGQWCGATTSTHKHPTPNIHNLKSLEWLCACLTHQASSSCLVVVPAATTASTPSGTR